jgi:hypothetical protein
MNPLSDITRENLNIIAGRNGTKAISGTDQITVDCIGFRAAVDTVIASIVNDTHNVGTVTGYTGKIVLAGQDIWFGMTATKITLTSGNGEVYRASPPVIPAIPTLASAITNAGGTTVTLQFSELMANPAAFTANYVLKVAGEAVAVTSVESGSPTSKIVVTPTAAIVNGDVVTITMQSTNIVSAAGAYFAGVADYPVTNIVPE